jgi:putative transposase
MNTNADVPIRTFDRNDEFTIIERSSLPHWTQAGTLCFITWRTWDSLPKSVLAKWLAARAKWLQTNGIDSLAKNWRSQAEKLPLAKRIELRNLISERWESSLDECHGACELRRPECAQIVADSLLSKDGIAWYLMDFVIMPNHVHLLVAFPTVQAMFKQCSSWKHFTAVQLNRLLGRNGRFWEEDQFDHLLRSDDDFLRFRAYIANNPKTAHLRCGEFIHYTKPLSVEAKIS